MNGSLDYTRLLLIGLIDPSARDLTKMRASAREALERACERRGIARAHAERTRRHTHEIDPDTALGLMAASERLGLANTALSSLYQDPQTPAFPALAPLAAALASASIDGATGLREAYAQVASALEPGTDDTTQALLTACDRIVDSTNTIVELWGRATPATKL